MSKKTARLQETVRGAKPLIGIENKHYVECVRVEYLMFSAVVA